MPGIFPRLKELLFTGFGPVTRLVAIICFMASLLPKNHPCFQKSTKDQFGLRHILAAAANNVKFEWKHIDQIVIFTAILCGTVMMFLYLVGMIFFVLISPASAMGGVISDMFVTLNPEHDIAFMMLDRTFGLPDIFNSCIATGTNCFTNVTPAPQPIPFPTPFHLALHELFRFYSMGIFFIALFIFLYFIVNIVFDITQTGKVAENLSDGEEGNERNFGWLPLRFVICFGLLLPFGEGLNSAQWITLYVAKFGSGVATNAWINYNVSTGNNPTGYNNSSLVARPSASDTAGLIKSLLLQRSCINIHDWGVNQEYNGAHPVMGYIVNGAQSRPLYTLNVNGNPVTTNEFMPQNPPDYNVSPSAIANGTAGDTFIDILNFSNMGDIHLVLGVKDIADPTKYDKYPGGVLPVCGSVTVPVTGRTGEGIFAAEGYFFAVINMLYSVQRPGVPVDEFETDVRLASTREYNRTSSAMRTMLNRDVGMGIRPPGNPKCFWDLDNDGYETLGTGDGHVLGLCTDPVPASYWQNLMYNYYSWAFETAGDAAYDFLAGTDTAAPSVFYHIDPTAWDAVGVDNPFLISTGILEYGWGGAGLWYNKISERNGSLYTAVKSLPVVEKYPMIMEQIKAAKKATDTQLGSEFCETYNPRKSGTSSTHQPGEKSQFLAEEATALHSLCTQLFDNEGIAIDGVSKTTRGTNVVEATIQSLFPEFKAFDINSIENREVTPMAQLSAIGRMMLDRAIFGVIGATAASAAGGAAHIIAAGGGAAGAEAFGELAGMTADLMMTFAMITLVFGILLHYILPFMPFVYFFFAVGRWVKVIFEALVGVPLWALAHMRMGGQGLPGDAASSGYFLLLEIFIRPVVTVFSLVAAFAIFSGLATGLNTLFVLVSTNLFGVSPTGDVNIVAFARGTVDQFFLSVLYISLTYMIGTGSFKLIDLIPDNILRWSGAGVQSMGASDVSDDLIEEWEWQLPYRVQGLASEGSQLIKETLYTPGKQIYESAKSDAIQNAIKEEVYAQQAARQVNKLQQEAAAAEKSGNTSLAKEKYDKAQVAQENYRKLRADADGIEEKLESGFGVSKGTIQNAASAKLDKSPGEKE